MEPVEVRIRKAQESSADELWPYVRDTNPAVLEASIYNRHFNEDMAMFVAKSRSASAELLGMLANDVRFRESYSLKYRICRNPRTPQRVIVALLKFIRIFDLADMTRNQHIHVNIRQRIEVLIRDRLKGMPLGIMMALARRANPVVLMSIMEQGDETVVKICLDNPCMTEGHICRLINRPATSAKVIKEISLHERWTLRYHVRFALIRNLHSSLVTVRKFIASMKTSDLRDLYEDAKLPASTRPFIFRELMDRNEPVNALPPEVHELAEDEDSVIPGAGHEV